jgi:MFS family permease
LYLYDKHEPVRLTQQDYENSETLAYADTDEDVTPGEIAGVIIGRSSEYFDFFVFGIACVLVFPPAVSLSVQARWHAGRVCHFLAGLCGPPCGHGAVHGRAAPLGRATKLTLALLLLGVCTVGMTFLPSYEDAGMKAVWALVILRVGQGLALGGTWDGLPSLLAMSAPKNKRGWYSMMGSWARRWASSLRQRCLPICTPA